MNNRVILKTLKLSGHIDLIRKKCLKFRAKLLPLIIRQVLNTGAVEWVPLTH